MNENKDVIILGKTQFSRKFLKGVTQSKALRICKTLCHEDRIINAWKIANDKK